MCVGYLCKFDDLWCVYGDWDKMWEIVKVERIGGNVDFGMIMVIFKNGDGMEELVYLYKYDLFCVECFI